MTYVTRKKFIYWNGERGARISLARSSTLAVGSQRGPGGAALPREHRVSTWKEEKMPKHARWLCPMLTMSHIFSKVTKSHKKPNMNGCVCLGVCVHARVHTHRKRDKSVCHEDVWEGFWNARSTKCTFRLSCTLMSGDQEVSMSNMSYECLHAHVVPPLH